MRSTRASRKRRRRREIIRARRRKEIIPQATCQRSDTNNQDDNGHTAFHLAAHHGHAGEVRMLLSFTASASLRVHCCGRSESAPWPSNVPPPSPWWYRTLASFFTGTAVTDTSNLMFVVCPGHWARSRPQVDARATTRKAAGSAPWRRSTSADCSL